MSNQLQMYTNSKIQVRVSKLSTYYITLWNAHLISNARSKLHLNTHKCTETIRISLSYKILESAQFVIFKMYTLPREEDTYHKANFPPSLARKNEIHKRIIRGNHNNDIQRIAGVTSNQNRYL